MPREIYDTETLLGVMTETESPSNYWQNLLFPNTLTFDDEWIDMEKIPSSGRKLAPFVTPLAQGRPIYQERSRVARFKPAYVKPKDPVTAARMIARRPGEILSPTPSSPAMRWDATVKDILQFHRDAIERRWEWLAAQAVLNGSVTIAGEDYPEVQVDFGRAAGHTVTLGAGSRWGDAGISIADNIQTWMDLMHMAEFGGAPDRITMGTAAWAKARKDSELKDLLDTNYRGEPGTSFNRGLLPSGEVRFVGTFGAGIPVYVYSDYYTVDGVVTPFMDPRDVVMTGPGVQGYRCFGAILDKAANLQPLPMFPKMWDQEDPSATFIMTQSSPLMVPVNPNATFRARVIA